jgi:uncharacterized membrane protein (DUF2068 family)
MRMRVYLAIASHFLACAAPRPSDRGAADGASAIPLAEARDQLAEAGTLCAADGSRTWGVSLCGPMMLVDPDTRAVVASQADAEGRLRERGGVFVGVLPAGINVANTSVAWAGVRWIQMRWPLPQDRGRRAVLMMHESFHRVAEQVPIVQAENPDCVHLDTLDGRYYLQLEWRALATALRATTEVQRRGAIGDALAFRQARRGAFPGSAGAEDALELNEGLAEYTGVIVGLRDPAARVDAALRDLAAGVETPTFVRSFAYATGPALGLLLDRYAPGWRTGVAHARSLTELLAAAVRVRLPDADRAAASYDGGALRAAEQVRATAREAILQHYRERLVEGAVVTLRFVHMQVAIDPNSVQPIAALGSVYPVLRVVDDWGVLEVASGGALIKADWSAVVVPAPASTAAHSVTGDGWRLTLAPGWSLEPDERAGDLRLVRTAT